MKREVKDGWHTLCGWDVYIENEKIIRGLKKDYNGQSITAYPYRKDRIGCGWTNIAGVSYWAFISGYKRGTVRMF